MSVLFLSIIHVAFLCAIAVRLLHIGYSSTKVTSLCFMSFSAWPLFLLAGLVTNLSVLRSLGGLSLVLTVTLFYYLYLEVRILLENPAEQQSRLKAIDEENNRHDDAVQQNADVLANLFPIKSYVGDASNLEAISDLGKLRDAGIRCRIEGNMVKVLYVDSELIARVEQLIMVASAPLDGHSQDLTATS